MKKVIAAIVCAGMLMIGYTSASAQIQTTRADVRVGPQHARIAQGRRSGALTPGETVLLRREQKGIHRAERMARADGKVTPREKMRLERRQRHANRHIRRAKHNQLERPE